MKKKLLSLFCLICFAWSLEGCKYLKGVEICVEHDGKQVCFKIDKDGDGCAETHVVEDGKPDATEDSGDPK